MLAIQSTTAAKGGCTPNILPCRIHHTGPTKVTKRYWTPTKDRNGAPTAYFRGRRLCGRAVKLPADYQGSILKTTERTLPHSLPVATALQYGDEDEMSQDEQEDTPEPVHVLEKVSTFDELLVWGHDQTPADDDVFVKNIEEWVGFAEAIHSNPEPASNEK